MTTIACRSGVDDVQAVGAYTPLPGCLTPGRRQDKRHRDVRVSERPRERGMRLRGRIRSEDDRSPLTRLLRLDIPVSINGACYLINRLINIKT